MVLLGNYDIVEELFRGPLGSVVRARLPGSGHDYVLKVFEPAMMGLLEADGATQAFLDRSAVQKLLAARGAKYWARIHEIHGTADGAYYVTDYCPLTVQKLIDRKTPIDAKGLHALVSNVVKGLLELRMRNRRAHGNLKPSNVFISPDDGDLANAKVGLCDPATEGEAAEVWAADMAALGNLIHQLVLHRPFVAPTPRAEGTAWPVPASPEWAALGRRADAWRDLCNQLLAPNPADRPQSLEAAVDVLRDLTPGRELPALPKVRLPKVRVPKIKIPVRGLVRLAAVVVVLAVLGGIAAVVLSRMTATAKSELAAVNGQWFAAFERSLRDPKRREAYRAEPGLKPIVEDLERAEAQGIRFDGAHESPYSVAGYRKTRAALATVERARQHLAADRWKGLADTIALQRRYEMRHWDQPAGFLGELVRRTQPAPGNDVAAGIDRYLRVRPKLTSDADSLETTWKQLDADLKILEGTGDSMLLAFANYYRNTAAALVRFGDGGIEGADDLKNELPQAGRLAAVVAGGWPQQYGRDRFVRDVESTLNKVQPKGEDIRIWLDNVANYALVPLGDESPAVASLRAALKKLTDDVARQPAPTPDRAQFDPAKFAEVRAALEAKIAALRDTRFVKKDLASPNQGEIAAKRVELQKEFDALRKLWVTLEDPREWVASIDPDLPTESVRLKERWKAWTEWLKTRADVLAADQNRFKATRKATDDLKAALTGLDTGFPSVPLGLSPRFPAFASAAYNKREQELDALTAWAAPPPQSASSPDVLPVAPDPATIQPAAERYAKWAGKLKDLTRDFPINKEVLAPEDRPDEKWAKDTEFWNDPIVQGLVKADVERIGNLAKVSGTGRAGLVTLAGTSDVPEIGLAAWRRLGAHNGAWPAKKGELDKELELRTRVAKVVESIKDPAARGAWGAELKAQGPERWVRFTNVAAGPEWLGEASARREAFGVGPQEVAMLYPPARFNLAMYEARAAAGAPNPAPAAIRAAVEELRSAAAGPSKDRTDVADLLARLDRLDKPEPMTAALGAGQAPKAFTLPVKKDSKYAVQFVRVEPQGVRPFYLATTEVSLGLFTDLIDAAGTWAEANTMLGNVGAKVPQFGPQAWARPESAEKPIAPFATVTWHFSGGSEFVFDPSLVKFRLNRGSLKPEVGGDPSLDHPMQQVPAQAALYAAALLNCRLPTSREWQEAYVLYETKTSEDGWNLRDDTWRVQHEFTLTLRNRDRISQWPDGGMTGVYVPPDAAGRPQSARTRTTRDGTLLFRTVDSAGGATFKQLVGNVAEFVCDAPDAFDARTERRPVERVAGFLKSSADKVSVMGGSSLSPVEMAVNQAYPVIAPREPYADVGFRLAFTAPATSVAERLRWVLADQAYLPVNPVAAR